MDEVAIAGGGIAGLCAAIGLRDAGFEPTVYERSEELRAEGSGIWILPNGMAALDRLGVATAVERAGVCLDGTEMETADGRSLASVDVRSAAERAGLDRPMVSIRRSRLLEILRSSVPDDAIRFGRECTGVDPDGPTVTFADGSEASPAIAVGADGIGSAVRAALFPDASVRYTGAVAYRGIAATALPERAGRVATAIAGQGVQFGYSAVDDESAWWYASISSPDPEAVRPAGPAALAERCSDLPAAAVDLIASTDADDLIRTPLGHLEALDDWSRGDATLVGDAAHAMTPDLSQGSAQAMEDAVALSRAIASHGPTRVALADYVSRRKDRADAIRRRSRIQGRIGQLTSPALVAVRNAALRHTPSWILQRTTARTLAVDF